MNDHPELDSLCKRAQRGEAEAASELIRLHYERVFAFLYRLTGNREDAEDLTQKTFARAWASLHTYQTRSTFSTWLHGIGYHLYVDSKRKRNLLESRTEEWWADCAASGPDLFEDIAERDSAHRLYALVEQLEAESREVIHLHYYQDLSIQETAEILGLAASTVKYRMRGALATIKSRLNQANLSVSPKPL